MRSVKIFDDLKRRIFSCESKNDQAHKAKIASSSCSN